MGRKVEGQTIVDDASVEAWHHLAVEALRRSARQREDRTPTPISECESLIARATAYCREHLEDMPEIRNWTWTGE